MSQTREPRLRRPITDLQDQYERGDKKPLEDLMRAWKGIKDLPAPDPRSFFVLGGYHGEPFRGAGWGNSTFWGGYCNHGNVLFPTWHRIYLVKLEEALRSIPGCENVTLPYWDECSDESVMNGVPWALTNEKFELDGVEIDNPLRSFVFPKSITDNLNPDPAADYSKPAGYETVRYPRSGLVGKGHRAATKAHNARYPDYAKNVELLNQNVATWLGCYTIDKGKPKQPNVKSQYEQCLDAPNYTVFSNATSATQYNDDLPSGVAPIIALENPHNDIHLAVGGYDLPGQDNDSIPGANGDMGENDTAGLDPIFFFHHCFVDYTFWVWQKKHSQTDHLDIISGYPGTNSVDSQGPTPGVVPNSWLTEESPLTPFMLDEHGTSRAYTSRDAANITKLGYDYQPGSLEEPPRAEAATASAAPVTSVVRVSGVNRAAIGGSFVIAAYATINGHKELIGVRSVLSRWHVAGCANCQNHLETKAHFPVHESVDEGDIEVHVITREKRLRLARNLAPTPEPPVYFQLI